VNRSPLVALVGLPNVGKSTLFNRMVGQRRTIVTDEPGVTRDRIVGIVRRGDRPFSIVDMGGLTPGAVDPLAREIERQAERALEAAAVIVLVVDARAGPSPFDHELARSLRRRCVPILVAANKVDTPALEPLALAFHELGLGAAIAVSAEHGLGVDDLLDAIDALLPTTPRDSAAAAAEETLEVRVAIVGRPNVGKSSLVNRLVGEERVLVSEVPGTTRDAVDTLLIRAGRHYRLVDTAGIRRKGKVRLVAEGHAVHRARQSIEQADVVVLVLDGHGDFAAQDAHIAGYASEAAKPVIVTINKWDLVAEREAGAKAWESLVRDRLRFVKDVPVLFVSAKSGQRVFRILEIADDLHAAAALRVPTPELNRWLRGFAVVEREGPAKGRSLRLFYAAQTGVRPPRFVLFCNDARRVHFSLRRRIENEIRDRFGFGPIPLRLQFRSRRERQVR
jgi:GTP-binding protein